MAERVVKWKSASGDLFDTEEDALQHDRVEAIRAAVLPSISAARGTWEKARVELDEIVNYVVEVILASPTLPEILQQRIVDSRPTPVDTPRQPKPNHTL